MGFLTYLFGFGQIYKGDHCLFDGVDITGTQLPAITLSFKEYGWCDRLLHAIGFFNTAKQYAEEGPAFGAFDGVDTAGRHPLPEYMWKPRSPEQAVPRPQPPAGGQQQQAHAYPID